MSEQNQTRLVLEVDLRSQQLPVLKAALKAYSAEARKELEGLRSRRVSSGPTTSMIDLLECQNREAQSLLAKLDFGPNVMVCDPRLADGSGVTSQDQGSASAAPSGQAIPTPLGPAPGGTTRLRVGAAAEP